MKNSILKNKFFLIAFFSFPVFKVYYLGKRMNNLDFISYLTSLRGKNMYFLYGVCDSVLDKIKKMGQSRKGRRFSVKSLMTIKFLLMKSDHLMEMLLSGFISLDK